MYKGQLEGFPTEIVEMMLQKQLERRNKKDVTIFETFSASEYEGFNWKNSIEGHDFWNEVIINKKFDVFFDKYSKQIEQPKYFAILRDSNNPLWSEYIEFLNEKYNLTLMGNNSEYYGVSFSLGLGIHYNFKHFGKEAVLLTLEQWYDLFIKPTKTDNMKTEFPKYFILSGDDNRKDPLWNTFIDWMNIKYKEINGTSTFTGKMDNYYGFDGKYTSRDYIDSFLNDPQLITIQEWYDNVYKTNKMENNYKFTIDYVKNNLVAIFVKTQEESDNLRELKCFGHLVNLTEYKDGFYTVPKKGTWAEDSKRLEKEYEIVLASEFIQHNSINKMEKEIIGYKLTKPEYKEASLKICRVDNFSDIVNYDFKDKSINYEKLKAAGVLDLWFEPIYKIEKATYTMGKSATGTFNLTVKDGKCFHKNEDITKYVQQIQNVYGRNKLNYKFAGYDFNVNDMIISKSGCENVETLLSQWLVIKL